MNGKIFQAIAGCVFLFAAIFVLSADVHGQSKKDQKKAKQLVEQGHKLFRQKNYRLALDNYTQAIALVPTNADARFWKGYAHSYLKETDIALTELDQALAQGYKPLDVYKVRWNLNLEKKNYDAAQADVLEVMKSDPNNADYQLALGLISDAKGAYADARSAYQKALLKYPNNGDLYYWLTRANFNLGDTTAQGSTAEEAIKKRTQFLGDSYRLLGDARQKQKRFGEAIDAYNRALSAKPDAYETYRNLAEIYRVENRFSDAIEISRKGLSEVNKKLGALTLAGTSDGPETVFYRELSGNIYTDLSWYYSLDDRNEDAIQAAQAGIRLLPKQYMAYTNLCRAYNDANKPDLAISACNNALKISENDGETFFYLGRANDLLGKDADATRYYKRAVTGLETFVITNPDYSDGFYLLGNAYFADNQREKAIEAYQKCLSLNPRFSKARYNIGIIQVLQKNKIAAMEQYNSLLGLNADLAGKLKAEIDKL